MTDKFVGQWGAGVLVILIAGLCFSVWWRERMTWRRNRDERNRIREFRRQWQPRAFDVSRIAAQIQQVRHDPIAAVRSHSRHVNSRHQLMVSARETILQLGYFQVAKSDSLGKNEEVAPPGAA